MAYHLQIRASFIDRKRKYGMFPFHVTSININDICLLREDTQKSVFRDNLNFVFPLTWTLPFKFCRASHPLLTFGAWAPPSYFRITINYFYLWSISVVYESLHLIKSWSDWGGFCIQIPSHWISLHEHWLADSFQMGECHINLILLCVPVWYLILSCRFLTSAQMDSHFTIWSVNSIQY